jgi:hypothetical protein
VIVQSFTHCSTPESGKVGENQIKIFHRVRSGQTLGGRYLDAAIIQFSCIWTRCEGGRTVCTTLGLSNFCAPPFELKDIDPVGTHLSCLDGKHIQNGIDFIRPRRRATISLGHTIVRGLGWVWIFGCLLAVFPVASIQFA